MFLFLLTFFNWDVKYSFNKIYFLLFKPFITFTGSCIYGIPVFSYNFVSYTVCSLYYKGRIYLFVHVPPSKSTPTSCTLYLPHFPLVVNPLFFSFLWWQNKSKSIRMCHPHHSHPPPKKKLTKENRSINITITFQNPNPISQTPNTSPEIYNTQWLKKKETGRQEKESGRQRERRRSRKNKMAAQPFDPRSFRGIKASRNI